MRAPAGGSVAGEDGVYSQEMGVRGWGVVVNQPFNGQPSTTPICHLIGLFGRLHSHCLFIVNV